MISKINAYAKINLALDVLALRQDGYHDIDTVFHEISLHDELYVSDADELSLEMSGIDVGILQQEDNLIWRAAILLQKRKSCIKGARIVLIKNIPAGAGFGGGSSDAAAALIIGSWQPSLTATARLRWYTKSMTSALVQLSLIFRQ